MKVVFINGKGGKDISLRVECLYFKDIGVVEFESDLEVLVLSFEGLCS